MYITEELLRIVLFFLVVCPIVIGIARAIDARTAERKATRQKQRSRLAQQRKAISGYHENHGKK